VTHTYIHTPHQEHAALLAAELETWGRGAASNKSRSNKTVVHSAEEEEEEEDNLEEEDHLEEEVAH
jgi:hypothetical protein